MQGDDRWACFASVGTRSLRIGLQPVSQPNTTTLTHRLDPESVESSSDPRSSPISNIQVTSRLSLSWAHGSFVMCPNKANKDSARCTWRSERRKKQLESTFVDLRHRPVGMYANEPLSGWKSKPLGAVKTALSHGDRDKLVSQPLDFELL